MGNDFPGPLSPEAIAQIQAQQDAANASYWGASSLPPAGPPAPSASFAPPAPPPAAVAPPAPPPPPPAPGPRPFSWNAPGFENVHTAPFSGGPGAPAAAGPSGGPASPDQRAAIAAFGAPVGGPLEPRKIPAALPSGPTAADDRAFAALRAKQDAARAAPRGGGGSSGPANTDPYGLRAADKKLLGTFDGEEAAMHEQATAEGDRSAMRATALGSLAERQEQDAAIANAEREQADQLFNQHMAETQQQLDAVRNQKIDPDRLMRKDGMGFQAVVGGLLGGLYMGLNHLDHNPFLDELNKQIDRDIASQEKNLAHAREGVGDSLNMLGQQRALYKDSELAKLQSRNLAYESVRNSIEAESAKYDDPIIQARAKQAITGVERQQAGLQKQIAERAQAQAASAAAAAAAQAKAAHDAVNKTFQETYEKVLASGASPAQAENEARRMVHVLHLGGAGERPAGATGGAQDPVSMVPKPQQEAAIKEREAYASTHKVLASIGKSYDDWERTSTLSPRQLASTRSAIAGTIMSSVPGIRSDVDFKEIVEPNLPAIGDSKETLQRKHATIKRFVDAKIVTPTLDQHAPGWRGPAPVQEFNLDGSPR